MECKDIIRRNNDLLQRLAYDFQIEIDTEDLLEQYASVFTSYEEKRERLRIIAVKKDINETTSKEKKNKKRETLVLIGKRSLKKVVIDMETAKLKAELFCKLWQQVKNVNIVQEQEELIQSNISKLEKKQAKAIYKRS